MLFPTSSLRHKGVVLVPQLAQDNAPTAPELAEPLAPFFPFVGGFFGAGAGVGFGGAGSSLTGRSTELSSAEGRVAWRALLKVGQPEQASAPPVPSHLPSPGHVPTWCGFGDGEAAGVGMTCACIGFTGTGDSVVGLGEGE